MAQVTFCIRGRFNGAKATQRGVKPEDLVRMVEQLAAKSDITLKVWPVTAK